MGRAQSHGAMPSSSAIPQSPQQLPPTEDEDDGTGLGGGEENIFRDMTFDEVLEDLHARFLVNLPKEEMTLVRIYWQAEQAHWFYEDYLRPLNPLLPALNQRHFTQLIISSSPLYSSLAADEGVDYDEVWAEYIAYKSMVPCCGGILINETGDKCIMVRGWKSSAGWCFPRGKINSGEAELDCAIREVEEEVGFDLTGWINSKDAIQTQISAQTVTMFIAKGIPESTNFEPQTRKEIGAIEWVRLVDLPTWTGKRPKKTSGVKEKKFYNVTPFIGPLKRWLHEHGINPNQTSSKKKNQQVAQQTHQQQTQLAQPYRNLQPYAFDSSQAPQGASALDNLFNKFILKQEEDLGRSTPENVAGGDNKAGLERLFGGLDSAPAPAPINVEGREEDGDEDALARLLGAVSLPAHPAALPPPAPEGKQSKLLAVLNQPKSPTASRPTLVQETPTRSHQASLLSMLSSPPPGKQGQASQSSPLAGASVPKPMSLPTSPRPDTPDTTADADRARRQRALLEMTVAGMGLDTIAPSANLIPQPLGSTTKAPRHVAQQGQPIPVHGGAPIAALQSSPMRNAPPPPPYEAHAPAPAPIPAFPNSSGPSQRMQPAWNLPQHQGYPAAAAQRFDPMSGYGSQVAGPYGETRPPRPVQVHPRPPQSYPPPFPPSFAQQGGGSLYRPGPIISGPPYRPHQQAPPPAQQGWQHGFPPLPPQAGAPPNQQFQAFPHGAAFQQSAAPFPDLGATAFPVPRPQAPVAPQPGMRAQGHGGAGGTVHQPIPRPPAGAAGGLLAMLNDRTGL